MQKLEYTGAFNLDRLHDALRAAHPSMSRGEEEVAYMLELPAGGVRIYVPDDVPAKTIDALVAAHDPTPDTSVVSKPPLDALADDLDAAATLADLKLALKKWVSAQRAPSGQTRPA
jgi:hypothetical protein